MDLRNHGSLGHRLDLVMGHGGPDKEYTQVDLIANAVYIYMILLFVYIVLGIIIYGIREYLMSLKDKPESVTSQKVANANWSGTKEEEDIEKLGSIRGGSLKIEASLPEQSPAESNELVTDLQLKRLEVIHDEIGTGEALSIMDYIRHSTSLTTVPQSEVPFSTQAVTGRKYNLRALHDIKQSAKTTDLSKRKVVKMSDTLKTDVDIPKTVHSSVYQNNKVINDIKLALVGNKLLDTATMSIMVLKLVSAGVYVNFFLNSFNELMEFIADTGIVFQIVETLCSNELRVAFLETILSYCWAQWSYKGSEPTYFVQSRITIWRILCNMKISIPAITSMDKLTKNRLEFKIRVIIREAMKNTRCNDYLDILPMMAQAIDLVGHQSLKYSFYDLLGILVSGHKDCCMRDYLFESNTDLKAIIQHGLWYQHEPKLIRKTQEIYRDLIEINPQVAEWVLEISLGKVYMHSSASGVSGLLATPSDVVSTPGGWGWRA